MHRCRHARVFDTAARVLQFALPAAVLSLVVDCRHKDGHRIYALVPLPRGVQESLGALVLATFAVAAVAQWRCDRTCGRG
jgi:hypothetical protein